MRKLVGGCGVGIVLATVLLAGDAAATVTLTASRTDVLYTTDDEFDCGALARAMDADLPYNVTRIRAEDDTGQATSFRWKLPKPNVGFLLRDDPDIEGSAGGAFAVQAFCADVGSGCILTKESIDAYRRPTILYAGPTCGDGLPGDTRRQFSGDTVRLRVKADGQRGKAAKATVDVGYGRLGTPVLWASNQNGAPANGIGRDEIAVFLDPTFSVTVEAGIVPPAPIKEYFFDNGAGKDDEATSCPLVLPGAAPDSPACTRLEYEEAGRYKPHVEVRLEDDSAYCDNATVRVVTCRPRTKLDVDRSPRKRAYRSDDGTPEEVTVTLRNQASRSNGCPFILEQLTCSTRVKLGEFEEMERVRFKPAQCAENDAIFCTNDLDCGSAGPCLDKSHCSQTTARLCTADAECLPRRCAECEDGEKCIRVIPVQRTVFPGESAVFLREQVDLRSVLTGAAVVTETWEVKERFDRGSTSTTDRFKIRGPKGR